MNLILVFQFLHNNQSLLKKRQNLDFKPLKGIKVLHDKEVFEHHVAIMNDAVTQLGVMDCPVWGSSRDKSRVEDPLASIPENNKALFDQVVPWLKRKVTATTNTHLLPLLTELEQLTRSDGDSVSDKYASLSHFIKIFAITRILVANFPEKFVLIGGCMSAKDRMQSLVYASEIIIQLYHA